MEGAALAEKKRFDLAIVTAWHTEAFARTKKLPALAKIIGDVSKKKSPPGSARAFFESLRARGVPIEISRNEIN